VIIGAPFEVTSDVLERVCKVHIVAHGTNDFELQETSKDPYEVSLLNFRALSPGIKSNP